MISRALYGNPFRRKIYLCHKNTLLNDLFQDPKTPMAVGIKQLYYEMHSKQTVEFVRAQVLHIPSTLQS